MTITRSPSVVSSNNTENRRSRSQQLYVRNGTTIIREIQPFQDELNSQLVRLQQEAQLELAQATQVPQYMLTGNPPVRHNWVRDMYTMPTLWDTFDGDNEYNQRQAQVLEQKMLTRDCVSVVCPQCNADIDLIHSTRDANRYKLSLRYLCKSCCTEHYLEIATERVAKLSIQAQEGED